MDISAYPGEWDESDCPLLAPILPTFDQYTSREDVEDSPFPMTPLTDSTIQEDKFPATPPDEIDQNDADFFGLLPVGDTHPDPYPGGSLEPMMVAHRGGRDSGFRSIGAVRSLDQRQDYYEDFPAFGGIVSLSLPPHVGDTLEYSIAGDRLVRADREASLNIIPGKSSGKRTRRHSHHSGSRTYDGKVGKCSQLLMAQLRTTSRAPKRRSQSTVRKSVESPEEAKARTAHNQVEQQYRKRLNNQFEKLLAELPRPGADDGDPDSDDATEAGGVGVQKMISKAEVLDLAKRRIKVLEKERVSLERQNKELAGKVRRLHSEQKRRLSEGSLQVFR